MVDAAAWIYCGDKSLRLYGGRYEPPDGRGVMIAKDGIEGWLSTPALKTDVIERAWGNGAHDVSGSDITYAARTVTIHLDVIATGRDQLLHVARTISSFAGHIIQFRVQDDSEDTFVEGYLRPEYGTEWSEQILAGTITVVCPRPERLSWQAQEGQMVSAGPSSGGLSYGPEARGLLYSLNYGIPAGGERNMLLLRNEGTAPAYPEIAAYGDWPDGVLIAWGQDEAIEWRGWIGDGTPLLLDCRTQTASRGGVDVSRNLVRRGFPRIEAGGTLMLRTLSSGGGWIVCRTHDTYL